MKNYFTDLKKKEFGVAMMNALALNSAKQSVNSCCSWIYHQPNMPEEAKKLRKF